MIKRLERFFQTVPLLDNSKQAFLIQIYMRKNINYWLCMADTILMSFEEP